MLLHGSFYRDILPLLTCLLIVIAFFCTKAAFPQDNALYQSEAKKGLSLNGLSFEDVSKKFGKPDREIESPSGNQSWVYGSSFVFFKDGRVSAWSDSGELKRRSNLMMIRDSERSDFELFGENWLNPWTPRQDISQKEALDGFLIGEED